MKKKIGINFLAFILPIIMVMSYIIYMEVITNHNFFFNGEAFLAADMKYQYNFLFSYIHNVMAGKDSLLYSFYNSLGGNMVSTIGYYLASPFNLLYGFVSKGNYAILNVIVHMLKLGMCSLCMNIFLNYKFGYKKFNIIFSITYAFIGFNAIYYFNMLWQDVIYMTPLVIMGLEKLIKGNPLQYIICLSLCLILNFYFAYMLCIFCVLYFLYELFIQYKLTDFKKYRTIVLKFIISSIIAFGISCFFMIPLIFSLKQMIRFPIDTNKLNFSINLQTIIFQIISNIYLGGIKTFSVMFRERPIIYVGIFSFVLYIFYFLNSQIKKREKYLSLAMILIFLISFLIPHIQLFWQAGSFPNGYIDRFAYLYSFFVIILAAKQYYSNDNPTIIKTIIVTFIYLIVGFLIIKKNYNYLKNMHIALSLSFFIVYILIYSIISRVNNKGKKMFQYIVFVVVAFELIYNYGIVKVLSDQYTGGNNYKRFYDNICLNMPYLEDSFYRLEGSIKKSNLDSHLCLNHQTSNELSTNDKKLYEFMNRNGSITTYIHIYYDSFKLPILDSLLGIKYVTSGTPINYHDYKLYKQFNTADMGTVYIYKNPYALSLGYVVDPKFKQFYKKDNGTKLDNLNNLVKSLSGTSDDILVKIPLISSEKNTKEYYIDRDVDKAYVTMDHKMTTRYSAHGILFLNDKYYKDLKEKDINVDILNDIKKGDKLKLSIKYNEDISDFNLYYFNEIPFKKAINILQKNQLKNVKAYKNKVYGDINLSKDSTIMMTIPYDKGWHVYVDGEKVKYDMIADTFISIKVPKGYHKIEMKYYPRGIIIGIIISVFSTITLVIFIKKHSKTK